MWFIGMQILLSTFWSWRTWCRWLWNKKEREDNGKSLYYVMYDMFISAGNILLPKRAPLHILTTEPYMDSIVEQRAKGHIFPKSPVTHTLTHHVCTALQDTSQTWKKTDMNVDCGTFWMKQEESGGYLHGWWNLLVGQKMQRFQCDRAVLQWCRWSHSSSVLAVHQA